MTRGFGAVVAPASETDAYVCTTIAMGTVITVQVIGHGTSGRARRERTQRVDRALAWFTHIESTCSRFDAKSELRQLCARVGDAVPVSAVLFESVRFACEVAARTNGAFDPTVGAQMESRGYTREHRTGVAAPSGVNAEQSGTYRDIELDANARTITLHAPLLLDLGAVAKGLAIDTAATELEPLGNVAIDAGGDLFLLGHNGADAPWSVGIRHPIDTTTVIETVRVSDMALCTSGAYERGAHILDARVAGDADAVVSATVMAPSAMVADAMATAAFVLGPQQGIALLDAEQLAGVLYSPSLERFTTQAWPA